MEIVSVIIPIFNSQKTLSRAFESIFLQKNVKEIILVDDGSTDGSLLIAGELCKTYNNVIFIPSENGANKGACAARNLGLAHAKSEWVQFLDADDELLEGKIEGQIAIANNMMSFIAGNAIDCFEDGHQHLRKFIQDPWAGLIAGKLGITSANLWNREALNRIGGWNESLSSSQEYDLMFRLLKEYGQIGFCNEALTKIHKTKNSISSNPLTHTERINNWLGLRKEIKAFLQKKGLFTLRRNYFYSGYLMDFCKRNNCRDLFNGSIILGLVFNYEKGIKQKINRWRNIIYERVR